MKRVLLICYYFPPMGLAGVGRPLSLFKQLSSMDYECHVLTVKPVTYWAYEPELLDGCDTSRVFRAGSWDPQRIMHMLGLRKLNISAAATTGNVSARFFPDSKTGWVRPATKFGRTLVENYEYDAIISTSPPISAHVVAKTLAREFRVPWVADFRDYWTTKRIEDTYDKPRFVERGKKLLAEITSSASAVTTVNKSISEYLGTDVIIPNGYDERVEQWTATPETNDYVIGLPGSADDGEMLEPLLKVLTALKNINGDNCDKVRLMQIGAADTEQLETVLSGAGFGGRCEMNGYVPRSDVVKILSKASMFYLGMKNDIDLDTIPSRTFELLASGRPLLTYTDNVSALSRLIDENACGMSFSDGDIERAADYLNLQIEAFAGGSTSVEPLPEFARQFSSDVMVRKFAEVLNGLS